MLRHMDVAKAPDIHLGTALRGDRLHDLHGGVQLMALLLGQALNDHQLGVVVEAQQLLK